MILCACELYRVNEVQEKEPWNLADALGYMAAESGKHFDPAWIAALLRCEDQLKNLYERSDENESQHD